MAVKFDFIHDLEKKYDKDPVICYYCGKPLTFNKFYKQYELPKKFCSKKCKKYYIEETGDEKLNDGTFSSQTEKAIHAFLTLQYPKYIITHNLKDVFPPYEIDFCIIGDNFKIFCEYNGSLHCSRKKRNRDYRIIQKTKINDTIKKDELCINRQQKLVRLWSEVGLYSRPDTFNKALKQLKEEIDILIKNNIDGGRCIEIIVDKDLCIHRFSEDYRI